MSTRQSGVGEAPNLVSIIWSRRWVLLACMIVAGILGYGLSSLQPPRYTATSAVIFSADSEFDPVPNGNNPGDPMRFLANQATKMTLPQVLDATIKAQGLSMTRLELEKAITVSAAADRDVITVEAVASTRKEAKDIADGVPAAYREFVTAQVAQVADRVAKTPNTPATLAAIKGEQQAYGDGVSEFAPAELPLGPSSPQPLRDGLLLGLLALLVAAAVAVFRQQKLSQWATPQEASAVLDAPLLGSVPRQKDLSDADIAPIDSPARNSYRMTAITLDYIRGPAPWSAFVTGARNGSGATTTALNVASAVADQGLRVVLIDVEDGARPSPGHDPYGFRVSLDHLAEGHVNMATAIERHPGTGADFGLIRARVAPFADGQQAVDMRAILERLPEGTDMVLIDGPPILTSADAFALAGQVDAVVVVVDAQTPIELLEELQSRCDLTGVRIAGIIANELPRRSGRRKQGRPSVPSGPRGDLGLGGAIPSERLAASGERFPTFVGQDGRQQ